MIEPAGSATNLNLPEEARRPFANKATHEPSSGDRRMLCGCHQTLYMLARRECSQTTSDFATSCRLADNFRFTNPINPINPKPPKPYKP